MKTTLKYFSIFLFLTAIFSSCQKEEIKFDYPAISNDNLIPLEDALDNANQMFSLLSQNTRAERTISDIHYFIFNNTRNGENQELNGFYIVNYGDNDGFALLSADKRRAAVYGISETGHLNLNDTISNKGLSFYLNNIIPQIDENILTLGTNGIEMPTPGTLPNNYYKKYSDPLLGILSKFGQSYPWNIYCYTNTEPRVQALVGCMPLAIGTIMGYYQWPDKYNGFSFDWPSMSINNTHEKWARLFEILGRPQNLNAEYGTQVTIASTAWVERTFSNLKYKEPIIESFIEEDIQTNLQNSDPILCFGTEEGASVGHLWVIDGAYTSGSVLPSPAGGKLYILFNYYHCVWGWGGISNGYYYYSSSLGGEAESFDNVKSADAPIFKDLFIYKDFIPIK